MTKNIFTRTEDVDLEIEDITLTSWDAESVTDTIELEDVTMVTDERTKDRDTKNEK